jgi:hypothetical protein
MLGLGMAQLGCTSDAVEPATAGTETARIHDEGDTGEPTAPVASASEPASPLTEAGDDAQPPPAWRSPPPDLRGPVARALAAHGAPSAQPATSQDLLVTVGDHVTLVLRAHASGELLSAELRAPNDLVVQGHVSLASTCVQAVAQLDATEAAKPATIAADALRLTRACTDEQLEADLWGEATAWSVHVALDIHPPRPDPADALDAAADAPPPDTSGALPQLVFERNGWQVLEWEPAHDHPFAAEDLAKLPLAPALVRLRPRPLTDSLHVKWNAPTAATGGVK